MNNAGVLPRPYMSLGVKTLAEFVALAKKKPGSVDFASTGAGSASHLAGELFNQRAGIDMVHVPYKGGAPAVEFSPKQSLHLLNRGPFSIAFSG